MLSHVWLWDPMGCSPPASSLHGIFQARMQVCVAISNSSESARPRDVSCESMVLFIKLYTERMYFLYNLFI